MFAKRRADGTFKQMDDKGAFLEGGPDDGENVHEASLGPLWQWPPSSVGQGIGSRDRPLRGSQLPVIESHHPLQSTSWPRAAPPGPSGSGSCRHPGHRASDPSLGTDR